MTRWITTMCCFCLRPFRSTRTSSGHYRDLKRHRIVTASFHRRCYDRHKETTAHEGCFGFWIPQMGAEIEEIEI